LLSASGFAVFPMFSVLLFPSEPAPANLAAYICIRSPKIFCGLLYDDLGDKVFMSGQDRRVFVLLQGAELCNFWGRIVGGISL
jgi:hypothetical protein